MTSIINKKLAEKLDQKANFKVPPLKLNIAADQTEESGGSVVLYVGLGLVATGLIIVVVGIGDKGTERQY